MLGVRGALRATACFSAAFIAFGIAATNAAGAADPKFDMLQAALDKRPPTQTVPIGKVCGAAWAYQPQMTPYQKAGVSSAPVPSSTGGVCWILKWPASAGLRPNPSSPHDTALVVIGRWVLDSVNAQPDAMGETVFNAHFEPNAWGTKLLHAGAVIHRPQNMVNSAAMFNTDTTGKTTVTF